VLHRLQVNKTATYIGTSVMSSVFFLSNRRGTSLLIILKSNKKKYVQTRKKKEGEKTKRRGTANYGILFFLDELWDTQQPEFHNVYISLFCLKNNLGEFPFKGSLALCYRCVQIIKYP
jgi:hypothetical protein